MNRMRLVLPMLCAVLMLGANVASAASQAVKDMANIVMNLSHHPGGGEKETLKKIIDNPSSTAGERALAKALLNMDHEVGGGDKAKLQDLMKSASAPVEERDLASILIGLAHKASAADKDKLKQLMK